MKTNQLYTLFLCLICAVTFAQEVERIEVSGTIVVDRNEVEGVTVFNHSSQQGTVTDEDGNFTIKVTTNDKIEFGALQFQNFVVIITEEIIDSKKMTVHLLEEVNKLPEVVILPYGLTGNLEEDVASVDVENPDLNALYFGLDNLDKIEFVPDHLTEVRNVAMEENSVGNKIVYGLNMKNIIGLVADKLFKSKVQEPYIPILERKTILQVYSMEYLKEALNMVEKDISEFIYFVEENEFDLALLDTNKEIEFLNYLKQKKKEFLILKYGRN